MKRVVIDTNVFVDWMNLGLHDGVIVGPGHMRILSVVVLMELKIGATTAAARKAVSKLERAYHRARRIVAPPFDDAGDVLRRLRANGRDIRRAAFVDDVLIALTARDHGATVLTRDRGDFAAIREVRDFRFEVVA